MIRPEIKRILTFGAMVGKKVEAVELDRMCLRIVFTDGTFADFDVEASATGKIVLDKGKPRRTRPYH